MIKCGECEYNRYNVIEEMFYCGNEDSENFGIDTAYDDECEDGEEK
ncbi:hypothetical protein M2149_000805 [Lachnospiraceae bacterium PFB1-21]